jgi:hypothetical protein
MKIFLIAILLSASSHYSFSQDQEGTNSSEKKKSSFSLLFGGAAGNFAIDASKFNSVYSNRSVSRIYVAGIGGKQFLLIGKYREFYARGTSIVQNIDVRGKADWKQKFYSVGIRLLSDDSPLYADLLYVVTKAEETITTNDPIVNELTLRQETENKGGGVALGVTITILGPIKIFAEGDYSYMVSEDRNNQGKVIPKLGGACVSAGVVIIL